MHYFEPDRHAIRVAGEAFLRGERQDVVGDRGEALFGEVDHAIGAQEVVRREAAGEAGGARRSASTCDGPAA